MLGTILLRVFFSALHIGYILFLPFVPLRVSCHFSVRRVPIVFQVFIADFRVLEIIELMES